MANFPSNPSNGNTHTIGNTIWVYNSTSDSWLIQDVNEYAVANLENTPPANPDEGTIWYDSQTTGRLYIYIDSNWIDASPGDVSVITGGNDITATKSGATYTLNVDDSFVRNTGDTMTGTLTMSGTTPQIHFNGTSDSGVDMAIKATPESLQFYEPEDSNKVHFEILDDTGVNAPYGYKWNGQSLDDRYISGISTGGGLSGSGTSGTVTVSHADTSSQGSSNNSGRTYIQDITLDGYGHVTGIATATETVVNTDTNTTYTADGNYGMTLSGTAFRLENDRRRNATGEDIYSGNTHDYTHYDADVGIRWYTANSEDMRLTDAGNLHVDGDVTAFSTTVSDERLKHDIEPITGALEILDGLGGYTFTYNKDGKASAGVIAQEVELVLPSAVTEQQLPLHSEDDETYKTVQYDQLVGVLIAAVKELKAEIEELKAAK